MSLIKNPIPEQKRKSAKELRKFGILMAIPLTVIGILLLWRGRFLGPYVTGLAALFLIFGLLFPQSLRMMDRFWMGFSRVLSIIMTLILLTLTFFLIITPLGLLMRIFSKDILQKRFDRTRSSYWVEVEPDGPCSRPEKPY